MIDDELHSLNEGRLGHFLNRLKSNLWRGPAIPANHVRERILASVPCL